MNAVEKAAMMILQMKYDDARAREDRLQSRLEKELSGTEVVLEEFDVEGCGHPDALVFRRGADEPYVVVRGFGGDFEAEEAYANVCDAYEAANPRIIDYTTVRWEKEDVRERLRAAGLSDCERNVDSVLEDAEHGLFAEYLAGRCIEAGNDYIASAIVGMFSELEEEE